MSILDEVSLEEAVYKTRHMAKESKKFRSTVPFHSPRNCEDRNTCAWHRRKR